MKLFAHRNVFSAASLFALLMFAGCGGGDNGGGGGGGGPIVSQVVGIIGGTVTVVGGTLDGTELTVPPGALGGDVTIEIWIADDLTLPPGLTTAGPAASFTPAATAFGTPAAAVLPFTPANFPPGATTDDLVVLWENASGTVTVLVVVSVDVAANTVTVNITALGTFQVAVNDSVTANDDTANINEDDTAGVIVNVVANDSDTEGDALTVTVESQPANGSVVDNGDGTVTYTPAAGFNGIDTFTYSVTDLTFGTDTATVTVVVASVNDAPVAADDSYTVNEDETLDISAPGLLGNDTDVDGDALTLDTGTVVRTGIPAWIIYSSDGSLMAGGNPNENGTITLTYQATDGFVNSNTATVTITVVPVNDVPVATNDTLSLNEDATGNAVVLANDNDVDGDTLTVTVTTAPANGTAIVLVDQSIDYTSAANYFGSDQLVYTVDDGNGGTATATLDFTVASVNDAPSFSVGSDETVLEDAGAQTVTGWATGISAGPANEASQVLTFNATANTNPTLFLVQPAIDPATGNLTYTPAADANGTADITITLSDDAGGADTSAPDTFTITVTAVNDAPSFTGGGSPVAVLEDAGAQTVAGWATGISAGPANESGQILTFNVTGNTNAALFAVVPAIDPATGNLTYTSAADANGTADITITLSDDGSTANGGADTSAPDTFTITVTAVNDAPSFTGGGSPVAVLEDAGAQTVAGWATGISAGPANESGQILTFNVTGNTNAALFAVVPAIDPATGNLTYTSAADANGTADITITLSDDGSTANGGADTSAPDTFTITVTAVNDRPVSTAGLTGSVDEDNSAGVDIVLSGTDVDIGETASLTFAVDTASPVNGTVTLTGNTAHYTPTTPNYNGTDTFTFTVTDTSGQANDTSAPATVTVTVNSVNDEPVADAGTDASYNAGETTFLDGTASSDVDGDSMVYSWSQTAGTAVELSDPNIAQPVFTVPYPPTATEVLTFSLTVGDPTAMSALPSTVNITTRQWSGTPNVLTGNPFALPGGTYDAPAFPTEYHSVVHVSGNYTYFVGGSTWLKVYDTTDPTTISLDNTYTPASPTYEFVISGTTAYLAQWTGLEVVNITTPTAPVQIGTGTTTTPSWGVAVEGNYAYMAVSDSILEIMDITTPATPTVAGTFAPAITTDGNKVVVSGSYAYVLDGAGVLHVFDVSVPTAPTQTSTVTLTANANLFILGGILYAARGTAGMWMYDLTTTPGTPIFLGSYAPGYGTSNVFVSGSTAYVSAQLGYLVEVVDVADPTNPVLLGQYKSRAAIRDLELSGSYVYVGQSSLGFETIDVTNPTVISPHGSFASTGSNNGVAVAGRYVYMAETTQGFKILDPAAAPALALVGSTTIGANTKKIDVSGYYAYTMQAGNGMYIFDVSDLSAISFASSIDRWHASIPEGSIDFRRVTVEGDYAYVSDIMNGLMIIDVLDPSTPNRVSNAYTRYTQDVAVSGNFAYIAGYSNGMDVVDVSTPSSITNDFNYAGGTFTSIDVSGNYAYLGKTFGASPELVIADISDHSAIFSPGSYPFNTIYKVEVAGDRVYIANSDGVTVVDVSDPTNPFPISSFETMASAFDLAVMGNYIYIANGSALAVAEREPLLTGAADLVTVGTTQTYGINWSDTETAGIVNVDCTVTGGTFTVTGINQATNTATVDWTLPAAAGDHEILIMVGDSHWFSTVKDRVTVQ